jgi:hypothetical protein
MNWLRTLTGVEPAMLARRFVAMAVTGAIALVLAAVALGYLANAVYHGMVPTYGTVGASIRIALGALALALAAAGVVMLLVDRTKIRASAMLRASALANIAPAARFASRRYGGLGALAALGLGFLLSRRR